MARRGPGRSDGRNTLYSRNPISKVPSYWEMVSLLGNSNAFKNKNGESEGGEKGIERTAWVVPGPFRGRRTRTLILNGLLGCVVTGESRTRILSPSPKEGE